MRTCMGVRIRVNYTEYGCWDIRLRCNLFEHPGWRFVSNTAEASRLGDIFWKTWCNRFTKLGDCAVTRLLMPRSIYALLLTYGGVHFDLVLFSSLLLQEDLLKARQQHVPVQSTLNVTKTNQPSFGEGTQITPVIYLACGVIIGLMSILLGKYIF